MMKRLFIVALALVLMTQIGFAQYKGAKAVTFKYIGVDTYSPYAATDDAGINTYKFDFTPDEAMDRMNMGIEIGYFQGITDWLSLGVPFRVGKISMRNNDYGTFDEGSDDFFFSLDARARGSLFFKDKQPVIPYLSLGLGGMLVDGLDFDMQIPVGWGLNFRLARNFYLEAQTEIRFSFDEIQDKDNYSFSNNMHHSVGFMFQLGDRQDGEPETEDKL
jgi:hypothetical protein